MSALMSTLQLIFFVFYKEKDLPQGTYTPQGGILFNPHALRGTEKSPGSLPDYRY
jgi:hypothetical protein